jgi:uncharacterized membrane protein YozB (DUF420 family)
MERQYRYLGYFLLLLLPIIALAFHQTYGSKIPDFEPGYDPFIHVHAVLATLWVAIVIVQPFLIACKKPGWHRTIGKVSYFLFPLLVLSFIPAWIKIIHSGEYRNLFFSLGDCILLVLFYALSIYYRKAGPRHMRFMIAATLVLLGPTIGRIGPIVLNVDGVTTQTIQYAIIFLILLGLIAYDRRNNKDYRPYLLAVAGFTLHAITFYWLFP